MRALYLIIFSLSAFAGNLSTIVGAGAGGSSKVTIVGYTTSTYNGNLGGVVGANSKCHADFSESRICTTDDIVKSGTRSTPPADAWVWMNSDQVAGGGFRFGCYSYASTSSSAYGMTFSSSGSVAPIQCNQLRKIACCK